MSKHYINDDFLLNSKQARELFRSYASGLPIIDYHCHLSPAEIADDRRFSDMAEVWLGGDHYKWRAMRANGVPEEYCTGDASPRDKFQKWAETMPRAIGNPLYHWTHLELKRYFDVDKLLSEKSADEIWGVCNERLAEADFSARGLMRQSGVKVICTTDDPVDSLEHHEAISNDATLDIQVLPAWRPDRSMAVEDAQTFNEWVNLLEAASDMEIGDFGTFVGALRKRHDYFAEHGCCTSDHGLLKPHGSDFVAGDMAAIFSKVRDGAMLSADEVETFKSGMLYELCVMNHEKDWVQQYHLGAIRNNSTRMAGQLGPDTGFDAIADCEMAQPLSNLLGRLDADCRLGKTIVYNLNPRDNALIVTMLGCFQHGGIPGKMQFGSGWWHLDQKDGMERQMRDLAAMGLLSRFVGMVTDSRSFLSYPRHEYFRRILCNLLGEGMNTGALPGDMDLIGGIVRDISYNNAVNYFGFDLPVL